MLNLTLPEYRSLDLLRTHLQTSVGNFYAHLTNRLLLYFMVGAIFVCEGMLGLALYKGPSILISHMAFTTVYALHTALTYACIQFSVDILACRFFPDWAAYPKRTVAKQWLIWSAGFAMAFLVHRTIVLCLVHIYAPEVVTYYAGPQHVRPGHGAVFLYILPYWSAGVFLAVNIIIQTQKRLYPKDGLSNPNRQAASGSLTVTANFGSIEIPHRDLSHVSVEDHYSRIYFLKDGALQNVLIRISLNALRKSLPEGNFFQVHRSHLVNLSHVCGFSKSLRKLKMRWAQNGEAVPVSRYRLADLRSRMLNCTRKEERDVHEIMN